jgi:hypothetical protein
MSDIESEQELASLKAGLVKAYMAAENTDGSRAGMAAALDRIQRIVRRRIPDIDGLVAGRMTNGIFTDALRYTAGRIDKRKARKKQERTARKVARAKAS